MLPKEHDMASSMKSIDWTSVKLSTVLNEHGTKSSGHEQVHSVSVHKGLINQIEHLGRSYAATDTSNYNVVRPGDIVYTKSPTGDFPLGVVKRSALLYDAIVSPLYGVFSPKCDEIGVLIDTLFSDPSFSARYLTPLVFKGAKNTINVTNTQFLGGFIPIPQNHSDLKLIVDFIFLAKKELDLQTAYLNRLRVRNDGVIKGFLNNHDAA